MLATQVLREDKSESDAEDGTVSEIVGFIIIEDKKYVVKKGETKIGRDPTLCSVVVDNCTVSRVHAVIESEEVDDSFIYDVGSTNQTKLGKKVLKPHCRYKLDSESNLTFGNVTAKFLLPSDCSKTDSVNLGTLDELGDIFDVATQVCIPHSSVPNEVSHFEKTEKSHTFKIPNSLPAKAKEFPKNEVDQCSLISSEKKSKTEFHVLENLNIFSLSTQCQIYEPSAANEANTVPSDDNHKSLLNDGQDDVLCTFMSLNSPKTQEEVLKDIIIKTEAENSNSNQAWDIYTQGEKKLDEDKLKHVKQVTKDFSSISYKPGVTSIPLNCKIIQNQTVIDSYTQISEENDYVKTQEFNFDTTKSVLQQNALSQNTETQPYLEDTFNDLSTRKQNIGNLILTQVFDNSEKSQQEKAITNAVLETEDFIITEEDVMKTQNDTEKEVKKEISTNLISHLNKESKSHSDKILEFTQRNTQDDFIETQVFKEAIRNEGVLKPSDNDRVPIATQLAETFRNEIQSSENSSKAFSRESSPDLLCSGGTLRNSEDCIGTEIFEVPESRNQTSSIKIVSVPPSCFNKQTECNIEPLNVVESSGDETESDLEIIMENNETNKYEKSFTTENKTQPKNFLTQGDEYSSYIFKLGPENHSEQIKTTIKQECLKDLSDSDETDCEEMTSFSPKILIKQEHLENIEFEETQVLTLTLPDNFTEKTSSSKDNWMIGKESPRFETENDPWSPLSLEMPSTQEIESSLNKILEYESKKKKDFQTPSKIQKIEVGIQNSDNVIFDKLAPTEKQIRSPLKRPLNIKSTEVGVIKKSKTEDWLQNTEKQFSRLVQVHDVAQIQPSRTRNSLKTLTAESKPNRKDIYLKNIITNEPSRRKSNRKKGSDKKVNGNITSYLTTKKTVNRKSSKRRIKKETSLKENKADPKSFTVCTRILRSSSRFPVLTETSIRNISVRNTRRSSRTSSEYYNNRCVNVVFTGFECESLEKIIFDLGGEKTNDLFRGEVVVVADKVRRTIKFLCAIGLSLPIASPEWLLSCKKEKRFLNPWNFILKDEESEEKWDFELRTSLEKSKNSKILQGFNVFATKNTKPPVNDLLAIVKCCGGTPLFDPPDVWPKKTLVVSCLEDKKWWPHAKLRNVKVLHYEFILSGVLRQKIDFKTYELR